jgi:hypothetical protein
MLWNEPKQPVCSGGNHTTAELRDAPAEWSKQYLKLRDLRDAPQQVVFSELNENLPGTGIFGLETGPRHIGAAL